MGTSQTINRILIEQMEPYGLRIFSLTHEEHQANIPVLQEPHAIPCQAAQQGYQDL